MLLERAETVHGYTDAASRGIHTKATDARFISRSWLEHQGWEIRQA